MDTLRTADKLKLTEHPIIELCNIAHELDNNFGQ